jgi:GntR family transcriptional regulator
MSDPQVSRDLGLVLSQASGRPMYMQIQEQVQHRVAVGDLPPGTKLPSIRELAVALGISVITVTRAYLELERDGVIVTQQGKGSWVGEDGAGTRLQQDELERHLERAAELAAAMGMSAQDLGALLARIAKGGGR